MCIRDSYRPLSYLPLSIWSWKDTIKGVFMDRINVVAEYDAYVNSPSIKIKIPSVVVLKEYIKPIKSNAFTRFNLFLRDEFKCQYCGSIDELTFDHVLPRSQGGRTTWENVVAACSDCNLKKGSKTISKSSLKLLKKPIRPTTEELLNLSLIHI